MSQSVVWNMLNVITIIVSKMTSHCADTVQMREESESGIRKREKMWFKTTAEDGQTWGQQWRAMKNKRHIMRNYSLQHLVMTGKVEGRKVRGRQRLSEWVSFTSHSTHNRSFRRRVFTGNHLHWYWQHNTNGKNTLKTHTQTNWPSVSKTHKNTQKTLN